MTEKPFFLFQKHLSKLGHSCEIHQMLSKTRRSIAGKIHLLCQEIESPDITGNYAATDWFRDISKITSSGALFNDTSKGSRSQTGASGYTGSQTVGFQAAKSNATFGKSSIVQPKTFYTLMIVKV